MGAVDLYVDDWKIDACFSASQKVLGGAAGLAPVTLSPRALAGYYSQRKSIIKHLFDKKQFVIFPLQPFRNVKHHQMFTIMMHDY